MSIPETSSTPPLAIAVMVSGQGRGSNLQNLIDACASGTFAGKVALAIGTRADSPALERARAAGVTTSVVSPRKYEGDEAGYANVLFRLFERHSIGLLCLAGYLRQLPSAVVQTYAGRIMNVHPALLPFFGGQGMFGERVHQAVLDSGMKVSGCTVHFVDEHYDTGPIIVQRAVSILEDDTPHTLAQRVLVEEHRAYAQAVQWFAEGRLHVEGKRVRVRPHPNNSRKF